MDAHTTTQMLPTNLYSTQLLLLLLLVLLLLLLRCWGCDEVLNSLRLERIGSSCCLSYNNAGAREA
jgi:hypothetical protein